jgi:hypothetical protein
VSKTGHETPPPGATTGASFNGYEMFRKGVQALRASPAISFPGTDLGSRRCHSGQALCPANLQSVRRGSPPTTDDTAYGCPRPYAVS